MQSDAFDFALLPDLLAKAAKGRPTYIDAFRKKTLLTGIYVVPAGAADRQRPHRTDEVYFVVEGEGKFKAGDQDVDAKPGALLYVKAGVDHRFHSVKRDLKIVVFFAGPRV